MPEISHASAIFFAGLGFKVHNKSHITNSLPDPRRRRVFRTEKSRFRNRKNRLDNIDFRKPGGRIIFVHCYFKAARS